jgi:hypothetical protein
LVDRNNGIYNRDLYLKERTAAFQAWADHLDSRPVDNVITLAAGVWTPE